MLADNNLFKDLNSFNLADKFKSRTFITGVFKEITNYECLWLLVKTANAARFYHCISQQQYFTHKIIIYSSSTYPVV